MSPLASFRQVAACSALAFVTCALSVATWAADKPAGGKPVELAPEVPDESWIPEPRETPEDLGAITI